MDATDALTREQRREAYANAPICPECGAEAELADNRRIYGRTFGHGLIWICPNWPTCDHYVGAHPDGKPKGTLAGRKLREARIAAHEAFDALWLDDRKKGRRERRKRAYAWMQDVLGLSPDEAHVGMFDEEQCRRLTAAMEERETTC